MFYKNSQRLNTVNYICEKLNIRCFIEFWVRLCLSSGFFYYYKLRLLFWILQDLSNLMRILFNPLTGAIIIRSSGFFIVNLEHVYIWVDVSMNKDIYSYTVDVNSQLICTELSKMWIIHCKYTLKFSHYLKKYILSLFNISFCQSILHLQYRKDISVIHQAWKYAVCYWPKSMPNSINGAFRTQSNFYDGVLSRK